jgi:hypothetical protein
VERWVVGVAGGGGDVPRVVGWLSIW